MRYVVSLKNLYSGQSTEVNAVSHLSALKKALKEAGRYWKHFPEITITQIEDKK